MTGVRIWDEFVTYMRNAVLPVDKIHPYYEQFREPLLRFLTSLRKKVDWHELEAEPEASTVDDQQHFLIPLTMDGIKETFCFTFLVEGDDWYFQHVETITIRLDKIGPPPVSNFPALPEQKQSWMREEFLVTEQVRLFNFLAQEKGRDFAFDWFKDGAGYFLAARTWVPFVRPRQAFILYLCWEQVNLLGNRVTLQKLEDDEALVEMETNYFQLYAQAGHLKLQISFDDYCRIFETIWQDRAWQARWNLQIIYLEDGKCQFLFKEKL